MFPEPLQIGPIRVYPMFIALTLGIGLAVLLAVHRSLRCHVPVSTTLKLALIFIIAGFIGGKAFGVLLYWQQIDGNPIRFLKRGFAGSGAIGAFLLAVPIGIWYLRKRTATACKVLDVVAPAIMVVVSIGRVGCLASGCCFGKPAAGLLWAVFDPSSPAGSTFPGQPLVPTQLYQAISASVIMVILLGFDRKKSHAGHTFCLMVFLYGLDRFIIDFYRYYDSSQLLPAVGGYAMPITQAFSVLMVVAAPLLALYFKRAR